VSGEIQGASQNLFPLFSTIVLSPQTHKMLSMAAGLEPTDVAIANGWGRGKDTKGMATCFSPPSKISWVSSVITDRDGNMQVGTASQRILSACRSRSVDLELQLKGSLVSPFLLGFQPIIFLERMAKALPRFLLDEERNKASAGPVFFNGN
jgi:hypothetical protein